MSFEFHKLCISFMLIKRLTYLYVRVSGRRSDETFSSGIGHSEFYLGILFTIVVNH